MGVDRRLSPPTTAVLGAEDAGRGSTEIECERCRQVGVGPTTYSIGAEPHGRLLRTPNDQRLVYCGALRAFLRPYFFDSFFRGSRVRSPAFLRAAARLGIDLGERAGDRHAQGAGLTGHTATVDRRLDVVRTVDLGHTQRLGHDHALGIGREVGLERATVDGHRAGAGAKPGTGDGLLAATGRLGERVAT